MTKPSASAIFKNEQRFVLEKGDREEMFKKYRVVSKTRFALFIIIMLVLIMGFMSFVIKPAYVSGSTEPVYETVMVRSGDTLWEIASRYVDDNTDIRMFIYDISKINELSGAELIPGQEILVPIF